MFSEVVDFAFPVAGQLRGRPSMETSFTGCRIGRQRQQRRDPMTSSYPFTSKAFLAPLWFPITLDPPSQPNPPPLMPLLSIQGQS